jgi:hypothetical protein
MGNNQQYIGLAMRIPDEIRSQRLLVDPSPIDLATNSPLDPHMNVLYVIYEEYMSFNKEDLDIDCGRCRSKILWWFNELKPYLIDLEKEYQLINGLSA